MQAPEFRGLALYPARREACLRPVAERGWNLAAALLHARVRPRLTRSSSNKGLVTELAGPEPATSWVRSRAAFGVDYGHLRL